MDELYGETPPDAGSFAEKVCYLDCALTKRPYRDAIRAWRNQSNYHAPIDWAGQSVGYHLSDGGYSRLQCTERGELFLSSNSRKEVVASWLNCKELIEDVEAVIVASLEAE